MERTQWEYCSLRRFPDASLGISHEFAIFGEPPEAAVTQSSAGEQSAWQKKIAELGREGWEMVFINLAGDETAAHFKRPIQPEKPVRQPIGEIELGGLERGDPFRRM